MFTSAPGFPLSLHHYYDRIRVLLSNLEDASGRVLSANGSLFDRFMGCVELRQVEAILGGVRSAQDTDLWDQDLFKRFEDYVAFEYEETKDMLDRLQYYLDAPNTVAMVLGMGRPEKVGLICTTPFVPPIVLICLACSVFYLSFAPC